MLLRGAVFLAAAAVAVVVVCCGQVSTGKASSPLPSLAVPTCGSSPPAKISGFLLASGRAKMSSPTAVDLCWNETGLLANFDAAGDQIRRNDYRVCNSATYNQEVVEVFIAKEGSSTPAHYLEVELTPNNVMYVAHISNPFFNGTDKQNTLVPCNASGIKHAASSTSVGWRGSLHLPWEIINVGRIPNTGDVFRANFFRVQMLESTSECTPGSCEYGCWSSTFTIPPSFHHSDFFGTLVLSK